MRAATGAWWPFRAGTSCATSATSEVTQTVGMSRLNWPWLLFAALLCTHASTGFASDPQRGWQLYNTAPQPGLLSCADCHGEQPQEQNFGNIWAGRHATFLIERAVSINTGGMGYFRNFYDQQALADIAAWLGTTPTSLIFPVTGVGASSPPQGVTLKASTKAAISGLSWKVEGDYSVSPGRCSSSVERFSACALELSFSPIAAGPRSGALLISHDGLPSPLRITLSGTGDVRPQAIASVHPATLEFGASSTVRTATLRNDSAEPLTVRQVQVSGEGFRWAGGSCTAGLVLTEKATCSVVLALQPVSTGITSGQLAITHSGQGGSATIDLRGAVTRHLPRLHASATALDLGVVTLGETITSSWISFTNDGPGIIVWAVPHIDGPGFRVAESDCIVGTSMPEGSTCRVRIAYQPGLSGLHSSTLRWTSSTALTPEVPVSGSATTGAGLLRTSLSSMVFASAAGASGEAAEQTLVLVNQGAASITPGPFAVIGPGSGAFKLTGAGDCTSTSALAPGTSCTLRVRFTPTAQGWHRAKLAAGAGPTGQGSVHVALSGYARDIAEVRWVVDKTLLNVGDDTSGSAIQTVGVHNLDARSLSLGRIAVVGGAAGDIALSGNCKPGSAIAGGQSCQIEVKRTNSGQSGHPLASLLIQTPESTSPIIIALDSARSPPDPEMPPIWGLRADGAGPTLTVLPAGMAPGLAMEWSGLTVGEAATPRAVTVLNPSSQPSQPMRWGFAGSAAQDWSVASASVAGDCQHGQVLQPGGQCTLWIRFHPTRAGVRRGWLYLPGRDMQSALALVGGGWAAPLGRLELLPRELTFQSTPGTSRTSQRVVLVNEGAASTRVAGAGVAGAGFQLLESADNACPPPPFDLLPGLSCTLGVAWSGTAEGSAGAELVVNLEDGAGELRTALAVTEDPSARTNEGGAGGAMQWPALLGLGWAAWLLRRRDRTYGHSRARGCEPATRRLR